MGSREYIGGALPPPEPPRFCFFGIVFDLFGGLRVSDLRCDKGLGVKVRDCNFNKTGLTRILSQGPVLTLTSKAKVGNT